MEWPRGMSLGPGFELVRLAPGCDMPIGFVVAPFPRSELADLGLGRECFVVKLPLTLKMESTQQVALVDSLVFDLFLYVFLHTAISILLTNSFMNLSYPSASLLLVSLKQSTTTHLTIKSYLLLESMVIQPPFSMNRSTQRAL